MSNIISLKINGIPSSETVWKTHYVDGKLEHVVTSNATRTTYYFYIVDKAGKPVKKGKAATPLELERKYAK